MREHTPLAIGIAGLGAIGSAVARWLADACDVIVECLAPDASADEPVRIGT